MLVGSVVRVLGISFICNISIVTFVVISSVSDNLCATVRKEDAVSTINIAAIGVLIGTEVYTFIFILDSIGIVIGLPLVLLGGMVGRFGGLIGGSGVAIASWTLIWESYSCTQYNGDKSNLWRYELHYDYKLSTTLFLQ